MAFKEFVAALPPGGACALLRELRVLEQRHIYAPLLEEQAEALFDNMVGGSIVTERAPVGECCDDTAGGEAESEEGCEEGSDAEMYEMSSI